MKKASAWLDIADILLSCFLASLSFITGFRDMSIYIIGPGGQGLFVLIVGICSGAAWCVMYGLNHDRLKKHGCILRNTTSCVAGGLLLLPWTGWFDAARIAIALACGQLSSEAIITRSRSMHRNDATALSAMVIATFMGASAFWILPGLYSGQSLYTRTWFQVMVLALLAVNTTMAARARGSPAIATTEAPDPSMMSDGCGNPNSKPLIEMSKAGMAVAACLAALALPVIACIYIAVLDEVLHNFTSNTIPGGMLALNGVIAAFLVIGVLFFKAPEGQGREGVINRIRSLAFWAIFATGALWFAPFFFDEIDFNGRETPFTMIATIHVAMLYALPPIATWIFNILTKMPFTSRLLVGIASCVAAGLIIGCTGFSYSYKGTGEHVFPSVTMAIIILGILGTFALDVRGRSAAEPRSIETIRSPRFTGHLAVFTMTAAIGFTWYQMALYFKDNLQLAEMRYFLLYPLGFIATAVIGIIAARYKRRLAVLVISIACVVLFVATCFYPDYEYITGIVGTQSSTWHVVGIFVVPVIAGGLFPEVSRYGISKRNWGGVLAEALFGLVTGYAGYQVMRWQEDLYLQAIALGIVVAGFIGCFLRSLEPQVIKSNAKMLVKVGGANDAR
ncbi:MAG: hypothetical protein Q6365_012900 [Candidatus Sigynarchaeota archaeon]